MFDRDTGLVHFGAREYDPVIGRFTSADPAGFGGGDTNLYAYAAGDPINLTDPDGNESIGSMFDNFVLAVRPDDSAMLAGVAALAGNTPYAQHIADYADDLIRRNTPNPCSTGTAIGGVFNAAQDLSAAYGVYSLGRWGVARFLGKAGARETALLAEHLENAVKNYPGLTPRQLRAAARRPGLAGAFRGSGIDSLFKEAVKADQRLAHLTVTPRFKFGPDVFDAATGRWWDVTRLAQWAKHVEKYAAQFGNGVGLFY